MDTALRVVGTEALPMMPVCTVCLAWQFILMMSGKLTEGFWGICAGCIRNRTKVGDRHHDQQLLTVCFGVLGLLQVAGAVSILQGGLLMTAELGSQYPPRSLHMLSESP